MRSIYSKRQGISAVIGRPLDTNTDIPFPSLFLALRTFLNMQSYFIQLQNGFEIQPSFLKHVTKTMNSHL